MLFLLTASCPRCGHKDFINLKIDDKKPKIISVIVMFYTHNPIHLSDQRTTRAHCPN